MADLFNEIHLTRSRLKNNFSIDPVLIEGKIPEKLPIIEVKQFNFNLPEDLKEYLAYGSSKTETTISQYLINLIKADMKINGIDLTTFNWMEAQGPELEYAINSIVRNPTSKHEFFVSDTLNHKIYKEFFERLKERTDSVKQIVNTETYQCVICHPVFQKILETFFFNSKMKIVTSSNPSLLSNVIFVLNKNNSATSWKGGFLVYSLKKTDHLKKKMPDEYGEYFYNQKLINDYMISDDFVGYISKSGKYKIIEKTLTNGIKVFTVEIADPKKGFLNKNIHYFTFESALAVINDYKRTDALRERFSHVLDGSLKDLFDRCINYESTYNGNFAPMKVKMRRNMSRVDPKYIIELDEFTDMQKSNMDMLNQIESLFDFDKVQATTGVMDEVVHVID